MTGSKKKRRRRSAAAPAGGSPSALPRPPAERSFRSAAAACAQYLLAAAIVVFVFLPWMAAYIQGQFFGLSGQYGTDFFRYSQGGVALLELGVDPYYNREMSRAFEEGRLKTDHPNPFYDEQMVDESFRSPAPIAKGVVSPPPLLLLIYPLVRLCGYTLALNVWTVAIWLGIAWLSVQFWRRLTLPAPWWRRIAGAGAMLSLLVLASFPVRWSANYGQFDVIYFLAIGGAIYLWSFRRASAATPLLAGLLLGIGGAVKIFPLVMLAYFFWLAVRTYRSSPQQFPSFFSLTAIAEFKVVVIGAAAFVAINLLTGVVAGFGVYSSFLAKLLDLGVEGSGPSMKCNLLSYLNFVPVWLSGPFAPMTGVLWPLYLVIAGGVVVLIAASIRSGAGWQSPAPSDTTGGLLELSLVVAALPTVLPHWWLYYNVILILPLMVCFVTARRIADRRARRWILALTALSFISFSYLTTRVFFDRFPGIYNTLVNRPAVEAALARASADPTLLENLPYSTAFGQPHVPEFEGRVCSLFNLFYGYPSSACLLIASWLALRAHRWQSDSGRGGEVSLGRDAEEGAASRRHAVAAVAGGLLLSFAGGYAMVWEGRRRLAQVAQVEFVTDEHQIEQPAAFVDQLLHGVRQSDADEPDIAVGGLMLDLPPPDHFLLSVRQSDPPLAAALLRQEREFFDDQAEARLLQLFGQYQTGLCRQYREWFTKRQTAPPPLAWRYRGHPGGLLALLERQCQEQGIPLRRLEQDWLPWQAHFLSESQWQRALEAWGRGDFRNFVQLVLQHHEALSRQQALRRQAIRELRARQLRGLPLGGAESSGWRAGFVYVQQPAYLALSTYRLSRMEMGIRLGTLYVAEELLRRGRLAQRGDPREALSFARAVVQRADGRQVMGWWSNQGSATAAEILRQMSQHGLFNLEDVASAGLLIWDDPLQ